MPSEEEKEQRILDCLRKAYPRDLSTKEIATAAGIDRNSLRGYLYGLRKAGLIHPTRQIGRAKLYAFVSTKHVEDQTKDEETTYVHKEKPTKQQTLLEEELLSTK